MVQKKVPSPRLKSKHPTTARADAIALLKKQHVEVAQLFKRLERASGRSAQAKLFEKLASMLVGHDAIEREIFYPACEKAMGRTDLLSEALVEHGVVEFSLYQADEARMADDFSAKCQVLSEIVAHHVKEEQDDFFPKVEKAIDKKQLQRLGAQMRARFEKAMTEDFRAPLRRNLGQVLTGTLKPAPGKPTIRLKDSKPKRRNAA